MANPTLFSTIHVKDLNLVRIQSNITQAFNSQSQQLNASVSSQIRTLQTSQLGPFTGGNLLPNNVLLTGVDNIINHGLGRIPIVWVVADLIGTAPGFAGSEIWRTDWDENTIKLQCSVGCAINLWVN